MDSAFERKSSLVGLSPERGSVGSLIYRDVSRFKVGKSLMNSSARWVFIDEGPPPLSSRRKGEQSLESLPSVRKFEEDTMNGPMNLS